jgi:AmmeMemoRadiSam system protein A/AmmeMemoRadiSam system protein B
MPIIASFMLPHPPALVPEVSRVDSQTAAITVAAYEKVSEEIARLKPDTIIVSSPHAEAYADYFEISDGEVITGSFAQFGCPNVTFRCQYDYELVEKISLMAKIQHFPAGTEGNEERFLDHGTMVPLYFINKHYTSYRLIRTGLSGLPLIEHYRFGELIKKACDETDKRIVFIASGDLSHCQKEDGPYGYDPEGPEYDKRLMDVMTRGAFGELFDFSSTFLEKAQECGHRSFVIMAGALDRTAVKAKRLSHEAPFGIGYGVCEFLPIGPDSSRSFAEAYYSRVALDIRSRRGAADPYAHLAYEAIDSFVKDKEELTGRDVPFSLTSQKAGAFVTIHEFDQLRGCIGTTVATQTNLGKEIIANAIAACSQDPRFLPIEPKEVPYLEVSVDVLSAIESVTSLAELNPHKYGIIVENNGKRGLLLPDLAGVETVDDQIAIAKKKAGIEPDEPVKLSRFTVVRHE